MDSTFINNLSKDNINNARLVGLIYEQTGKLLMGYKIFIENDMKIYDIPTYMLRDLLKRCRVININFKDKDIVCTECALSRLPRYVYIEESKQIVPASNNSIYVLGKIYQDKKLVAYRVIANNASIVDVPLKVLKENYDKGYNYVNVHYVGDTLKPNKEGNFIEINLGDKCGKTKKSGKKEIQRIVLTGGPCAGKSTAVSKLQEEFEARGWKVIFVAETATELITSGLTPREYKDFQYTLMKLQHEKERAYYDAAKKLNSDKVLLVFDRGLLDNKAFMGKDEFSKYASRLHTNELKMRDWYDGVFHLVTAAKGAEKFYTTANNTARTETPEQARAIDDKLIAAWTGHAHLRVIDNSTDFDGKMFKLVKEIANFLGEPEPLEIERKFLIQYPNIRWLNSMDACQKIEIIQTYLKLDKDCEVRIRQRGSNGNYSYYKTEKKRITGLKRVETEQKITQSEYLALLMNADTHLRQIRKNRYCFVYNNQYFELDVYPFWNDRAIMEIELSDENQRIDLPKEIKVIKDVTEDSNYKNSSLAQNFGNI